MKTRLIPIFVMTLGCTPQSPRVADGVTTQVAPPYDVPELRLAMESAAQKAAACVPADADRVETHVAVVIEPSGAVRSARADTPPFAGTSVGDCMARVFGSVKIAPFEGPNRHVGKSFVVGGRSPTATDALSPPAKSAPASARFEVDSRGFKWGDPIGQSADGAPATPLPPPGLGFPRSKVHGRLPPEVVSRIFRNHPRMRECYVEALKARPTLRGEFELVVTVDRGGKVANASARNSTLSVPEVESCFVRASLSVEFPQPEGGTADVVQVVTLSP